MLSVQPSPGGKCQRRNRHCLPSKINLLNIKLSPGTRFSARIFHILSLHPCEREGFLFYLGEENHLNNCWVGVLGTRQVPGIGLRRPSRDVWIVQSKAAVVVIGPRWVRKGGAMGFGNPLAMVSRWCWHGGLGSPSSRGSTGRVVGWKGRWWIQFGTSWIFWVLGQLGR